VEINSPGGDVFAALAIYNALKSSGKDVAVKVLGVAASAASLIAMAGDKILMPKNSFMMIHNPWSSAIGNADELRQTAETLDKIGQSLKATYAAKTGMGDAELSAMLAKDTWLTADEALAMGFATEVVDDVQAFARFDMSRAELPDAVKAVFTAANRARDEGRGEPGATATIAESIEAAAQTAGMGEYAELLVASCGNLDDATRKMTEVREIRSLCAFANRKDLAHPAVRKGLGIAEVRALILNDMAAQDENTHTSTARNQDYQSVTTGTEKPKVTTASLWASHSHGKVRKV
jgi:enoyl-CoA hydratase/carnithine racemase